MVHKVGWELIVTRTTSWHIVVDEALRPICVATTTDLLAALAYSGAEP
jgi:hypothetical protein